MYMYMYIPSSNKTWLWKIDYLYIGDFPIDHPISFVDFHLPRLMTQEAIIIHKHSIQVCSCRQIRHIGFKDIYFSRDRQCAP